MLSSTLTVAYEQRQTWQYLEKYNIDFFLKNNI